MPRGPKRTYADRIKECEAQEQRALAEAEKYRGRKLALIAEAKAAAEALLAQVGSAQVEG